MLRVVRHEVIILGQLKLIKEETTAHHTRHKAVAVALCFLFCCAACLLDECTEPHASLHSVCVLLVCAECERAQVVRRDEQQREGCASMKEPQLVTPQSMQVRHTVSGEQEVNARGQWPRKDKQSRRRS